MVNFFRQLILVFASICLLGANTHTSVESLFEQAETLKSQGKVAFESLLSELENRKQELSNEQWIEFKYYQNYYHALYSGRLSEVAGQLQQLAQQTQQNALKFKILGSAFYINSNLRNYPKALENLSQLQQIARYSNNQRFKIQSDLFTQELYVNVKKFEESIELGNKLLTMPLTKREECFARGTIAQAKWKSDQADFSAMQLAINVCEQAKEFVVANLFHLLFTYQYLKENNVSELEQSLYETVDPAIFGSSLYLETPYKYLEAEYFYRVGKIEEAKQNLDFVFKNDEVLDTPEYILGAYKLMVELYKSENNYTAALQAFERYEAKKTQYQNEENKGLYAYYLAENQSDQLENKIELLDKENQLLALNKELFEKDLVNNRLLLGLLLTLLASAGFLAYRGKQRNRQLVKMMEVDQLTQVSTRHHFYQKAKQDLPIHETKGQEVSFIIFDLDKFKSVNDTYGHLIGDRVLKKAIEVVKECWRKQDIIGRLGGEEFAVILPDCDVDRATAIAENCRQQIARSDLTGLGRKLSITASFGVTSSKYSGYQLKSLIADADRMMYIAKSNGRNRVHKFTVADSTIQKVQAAKI